MEDDVAGGFWAGILVAVFLAIVIGTLADSCLCKRYAEKNIITNANIFDGCRIYDGKDWVKPLEFFETNYFEKGQLMDREIKSRIISQVFGRIQGKEKLFLNDGVDRLMKYYDLHASKPLSRNDAIQILGALGRWMVQENIH